MGAVDGQLTKHDIALLYETGRIAREARNRGDHPFGALLADAEGTVLIEQGNEVVSGRCDCNHAETVLLFRASKAYGRDILASCTLYTSVEPCVMCTGALYWANVGRLVYGLSEEQLLAMTGSHQENPTFHLSCRTVLDHGQKTVVVVGPVQDDALVERLLRDHAGFWR